MALSRKHQKELDQLRADAELLLRHQQEVIGQAASVAREASRQAAQLAREEGVPRAKETYEHYVGPQASKAARKAGEIIAGQVVPTVGAVLGTAWSVADIAKDTRVQAALRRARLSSAKAASVAIASKKRGGRKALGWLLALGVIGGIGYAVWQTFRADDELWVADAGEASDD
ncbi:DNA helicase [Gryllotalpicola sp.]|uniref:DNA helicase n=1 Tax=Gryllotalpicola sp. TaxID=1932787 RepID=UPI0026361457|nr:DNA helicase [Gryllotalpicola sp.]